MLYAVLPAMCLTNGFSALGSSRQLVGRECLFFDNLFLLLYILQYIPALGCPAGPAMRRNQQDWPMPSTSPSPDRGSPGPGGASCRLAA